MSGGGTNTVEQSSVPSFIQPYYTGALAQGGSLLAQGGPQYYPGQQVANFTPAQQAGMGLTAQTALGPNASQGAQAANEFETSGALLNPNENPYLQNTFNLGAQQVQNNLSSEFAGNGSNVINSLPVQSDEMNNLATQLYGGAYNTGLQNMTQASMAAPGIDQGTYLPGQELSQVGGTQQQQQQNQINAAMQAYNYTQQLPYNTLSWYSGLLGENASPFAGGSSSSQMSNNPWSTAAGAGLMGAGLYNSGAFAGLAGLMGSGAGVGISDATESAIMAGLAEYAPDLAMAAG